MNKITSIILICISLRIVTVYSFNDDIDFFKRRLRNTTAETGSSVLLQCLVVHRSLAVYLSFLPMLNLEEIHDYLQLQKAAAHRSNTKNITALGIKEVFDTVGTYYIPKILPHHQGWYSCSATSNWKGFKTQYTTMFLTVISSNCSNEVPNSEKIIAPSPSTPWYEDYRIHVTIESLLAVVLVGVLIILCNQQNTLKKIKTYMQQRRNDMMVVGSTELVLGPR